MKNSLLAGAAETAGVQSNRNSPSGAVKSPKNKTASRLSEVMISNTRNNPSSVKNQPIGLNSKKG